MPHTPSHLCHAASHRLLHTLFVMHDTHHMLALARALGALREGVHELCAWYSAQKQELKADLRCV